MKHELKHTNSLVCDELVKGLMFAACPGYQSPLAMKNTVNEVISVCFRVIYRVLCIVLMWHSRINWSVMSDQSECASVCLYMPDR